MDELKALPSGDPRVLLRMLAEYAERYENWPQERCEVEVVASGVHLVGRPARVMTQQGETFIVLWQGEPSSPSIVSLRLSDVSALRIFQASLAQAAWREPGRADPSSPVPTRLDLKRRIESIERALESAGAGKITLQLSEGSGENPEERPSLAAALPLLQNVLGQLAKDPLGKEALKGAATWSLISLKGSPLEIQRTTAGVEIRYDWRRPLPPAFEAGLKEQIEAVL